MLLLTLALGSFSYAAKGDELNIEGLSDGACWYQQGEILKISSFNDKESFIRSTELLEKEVATLVAMSSVKKGSLQIAGKTLDMVLHCGSYGASLVFKMQFEGRNVCVWTKFNKGKLALRSFGGLEESKGELCDGYKMGEVIVGLKEGFKDVLEASDVSTYIESYRSISTDTFKIVLRAQYIGKEAEVMEALKKIPDIRYVELDGLQHPVGDYVKLR